jgi:ketosteroid isomerase-like protein
MTSTSSTTTTDTQADESQIRALLHEWAEAIRTGRLDEVLTRHAPDVLIYDVLPPLQYEGADTYRRSWGEWQPETAGPGRFALHDLRVTAGADVAFAHALIHCGYTTPDGRAVEDWVRATFCLRRAPDGWVVAHQHISMPRGGG